MNICNQKEKSKLKGVKVKKSRSQN